MTVYHHERSLGIEVCMRCLLLGCFICLQSPPAGLLLQQCTKECDGISCHPSSLQDIMSAWFTGSFRK